MIIRSKNIIAIPPGATIKEQLIDREMSQKEFASRMGMSEKHISKLINGDVALTDDVAIRLEMVLGLSARFWTNLESIYREKIKKAQLENEMEDDIKFVKKIPYKEMAKQGWVPETTNIHERVYNIRKHFEVFSLGKLDESLLPGIACRRQAITEKSDYALLVWAQRAKIEARSIDTNPINLEKLSNSVSTVRKMTTKTPEEFCPELVNLLAECGIALVFLPHIGGSFLHGASFYDHKKIVIGLTVRGKDADRFWFSLFHELGHILLGHLNDPAAITDDDEKNADTFARDALISYRSFEEFTKAGNFSKKSIVDFAHSVGIDEGIVVGRLQKEGYIKYSWYNDLKTQYALS